MALFHTLLMPGLEAVNQLPDEEDVERMNEYVARCYDAWAPAVLSQIARRIAALRKCNLN